MSDGIDKDLKAELMDIISSNISQDEAVKKLVKVVAKITARRVIKQVIDNSRAYGEGGEFKLKEKNHE